MHVIILDILFFCVEVAGFQCHHLNDAKSVTVGVARSRCDAKDSKQPRSVPWIGGSQSYREPVQHMRTIVHSAMLMSRARIRIIEPPRCSAHRYMQSSVQHHRNVAVHLSAMEHVFAKSCPSVRIIM